MAFEFGQSASSFRANNSDDFVDGAECASSANKRSQFWGRSHCRMHYGRFGVAGGGVSPGAVIGLLGGAAGVVVGELTLSFEATRVG